MNPFAGILLVARHAIRQTFGGGRFVGLLILLAIPLLISLVVLGAQKGDPAHQFQAFTRLVCYLIYQVEVPLLALILGVGVFGDEIEGRTITYLYTRPLPRPVIYLGRISFSVYLLHYTLILLLSPLLARPTGLVAGASFMATVAVATIALSHLSYRWVERPSVRVGNRACGGVAARSHATTRPSAAVDG